MVPRSMCEGNRDRGNRGKGGKGKMSSASEKKQGLEVDKEGLLGISLVQGGKTRSEDSDQ